MRRREFMAAALTTGLAASTRIVAMQPIQRSGPSILKLGLAAYSLRQHLKAAPGSEGALDLIGFLDYCKKLGVGGAELTSYYFPSEVTPQYLNALKRHAHMAGLTICGGAIRNDFCQPPGEGLQKDLAHTEQWVNSYAELGAPAIRIFAGKVPDGDSEDAAIARCIDAIGAACETAGKRGVMLALENHGGVTAKAETMLKIVQAVDSPWFGVNLDSGNFTSGGDPYAELAMIAPYAINAQIKTDVVVDGKKTPADYGRIVQILRDANYSGWVVLEYEGAAPPYEAIPVEIEKIRAAIA